MSIVSCFSILSKQTELIYQFALNVETKDLISLAKTNKFFNELKIQNYKDFLSSYCNPLKTVGEIVVRVQDFLKEVKLGQNASFQCVCSKNKYENIIIKIKADRKADEIYKKVF